MTLTADRLPCCVPFCRRTTRRRPEDLSDVEWICPDHWRAVPRPERAILTRCRRKYARRPTMASWRAHRRIWRRRKRRAIELAAGI